MNDLISRAAANDAYCMHECGMKYTECDDEYCGSIFADIPSAQPERKKGKWIINKGACEPDYMECSRCKWITEYYGGLEETWDFCPHCGCDMRQEGEDHETD